MCKENKKNTPSISHAPAHPKFSASPPSPLPIIHHPLNPIAFYAAAVYNHYNIAQITMRQTERVENQWKLLNARGKKKPLEV